jgi:hypothetical protein
LGKTGRDGERVLKAIRPFLGAKLTRNQRAPTLTNVDLSYSVRSVARESNEREPHRTLRRVRFDLELFWMVRKVFRSNFNLE